MNHKSNAIHSTSYKWIALSVVAMGSVMATVDSGTVRIALPHLGDIFQASADTVAWVWLISLLVGSSLMLTMGRIGDAFGREKLYTLGLFIFSLGLSLSSLAQSLIQLVVFRLVQAVGNAMTIATGNAIITSAFPSEERGKALGIHGTMTSIGLLSGPALGGILLDLFGWRSIFYARAPFAIIGTVIAWVLLKKQSPSKSMEKFDLLGAATLFLTLASLLLAVNRGQNLGWTSPLVVGISVTGILSLFVFLFVERRAIQPVLDLSLFRNRLFSTASGSHLFLYMAITAVNFLMPFYLIQGLGFSASKAGILLVTLPATSMIVSPLSGRLSDRWRTLFLCASGLTLVSVGILLLRGLGSDVSIGTVVFYLVVMGAGIGLFVSPNTSAIMGSVSSERLGTASAMVGTVRQIGMSIGIATAAGTFAASQISHAAQLSSQGLSEDLVRSLSIVSGFHDATFAALAIIVIGLVASILRGRR